MNAVSRITRGDVEGSEGERLSWATRHAASASATPFFDADTSTALLHAIAGALDIRGMFPRVSEIVQQVVPHDALALNLRDRSGRVTLEARSTADLPADG